MESEQETQYKIKKDLNQMKKKIDWGFLSDIESLLELNLKKKLRCIVFDTETTGIYHTKGHILELAAVEVVNFELTGRIIHIYIKPRVFIPKNVQEINHIKYDDYKNFWEYYNQGTKSQLQHFLNFIGNDTYLIAHNATFDYYFLMDELNYWGLPEISEKRFRCTLRITKKIFKSKCIKTSNHELNTLCNYFKILVNPNEGSFHNGLFDAIMTSKLFICLYKNYFYINGDDIPQKYKEKNNKEQKNNIIEKIDKINLNDKKMDIKQEIIDCNNNFKKNYFDLKKLKTYLKNSNEKEFIKLLSYTHFEDLLIIKKEYDEYKKYKLFFDINNCDFREEIKLMLLGLFYDNLELKCFFIHKINEKNKNKLIEILSEFSHSEAIKIKKIYLEMFGKDLLNNIKNDKCINEDIKIYLSFLLSSYFFPEIKKNKDIKKIAKQLINMKESNDIDLNFISYVFQSNMIYKIKNIYMKNNFEDFLNIFSEKFKKVLVKSLEPYIISERLPKMNELVKKEKYYDFYKILFLENDGDKGEFLFVLIEYIHKYKNFDMNICENANLLYKNVIEFNCQNIFIDDLIKKMNVDLLSPYIYIFDLHKIPFRRYIKSCYTEENNNYSKWADLIEEDLKKLNKHVFFLERNDSFQNKFNFKITESIPFIVKVIFEYYNKIKNNTTLSNKYIKGKELEEHKKIIKEISKNWTKTQHSFYRFFFSWYWCEIQLMRYYIVELLLPFIDEDEMKLFENSEYYFIKNKDKIKYFESNKLDFKCDCHMLKNFHEYLQDYAYVKYDNELHNEEGYEIHFNRNWEIKKKIINLI